MLRKATGIVDDDTEADEIQEGYEGAIVLDPVTDIYFEPISVSDFSSLYPSSIIAANLSHETFVMDTAYADVPGVTYETVDYENYQFLKLGKGDALTKVLNDKEPVKHCTFVQPARLADGRIDDSTRGVIPRILMGLLAARKATRKLMATQSDPFKRGLLDSLQAAYKVTANSVYGTVRSAAQQLATLFLPHNLKMFL